MDINRRQVLIVSAEAALAGSLGVPAGPDNGLSGILDRAEWHPLTRSLLKRARNIGRGRCAPDRAMVERTIRQIAGTSTAADGKIEALNPPKTSASGRNRGAPIGKIIDRARSSFGSYTR